MSRPVTLFTGQWADLSLATMLEKAREFGYDGLELGCWGDHFEVNKADQAYCDAHRKLLEDNGLELHAISNHLVGQCVCDNIDHRHQRILGGSTEHVWGDGDPEGVRQRAAAEMIATAQAAARLGVKVVNGFTGSSIWHLLYAFPPTLQSDIEPGFKDFADRWIPILNEFDKVDVNFGLEVHPTEIAFDIATAERAIEAVDGHPRFGFNYDPSHLGYQGVDYVEFIHRFKDRIFHVHMKDVAWSETLTDAGVFGGNLDFGDRRRYWDFRSPGRGDIDFEAIMRALNEIGYNGPLSVEWEDPGMDRDHGAAEAADFVREMDFDPAGGLFDEAFSS